MSMKLSDFEAQIDAYFDKADPNELMKCFEEYGYNFLHSHLIKMQNEPQNAVFIQPEAPANALFYFHAESISKVDLSHHPYSLERKNKRWQSPMPVSIPIQTLGFFANEHFADKRDAYLDIFTAFYLNFQAMYPHDISPNFDYKIIPERVVWAGGEYVFPNY